MVYALWISWYHDLFLVFYSFFVYVIIMVHNCLFLFITTVGIFAYQRVVRLCEVNRFEIHRQLTTSTTQRDYSSYFWVIWSVLALVDKYPLFIPSRPEEIQRISIAQPSEAWHAVFSQRDCCKAALLSSPIPPSSNNSRSNIPNLAQRYTTWI